MFAPADRSRFRDVLVDDAREDADVTGAALVGSAARGTEDAWSDIDLALKLRPAADESAVVERWTERIDAEQGVSDTLDVWSGGVRYRVFLIRSSLQIDVSFWPHDQFRATEDGFQLLFGTANAPTSAADLDLDQTIGMGWLYALHVRSALAREKLWQAVIMLDELRNQIIALACARRGLNPWHGREVDRLPSGELAAFARARTHEVSVAAIHNSQRQLIDLFLAEVELADPSRAARLREPLTTLIQDER
ncbi:nucleotidyltransferase domain-containing protein [Microbacterium deminutum]|uniref:Polymerase nucleotidyl transferase domain-containing protein n=1 Tax=Microbacterium deminutum TaxID=344164 RepID=A0ABP5CWX3_9MICO